MTLLTKHPSVSISTKPLVVILLGPPGAGKGTHAGRLSQFLNVPHISTGDLFRTHIRNLTPLGLKAKNFMDKGYLVPDELVLDMLFERIEAEDCKNGYLLDGFPRTLAQAEELDKRLGTSCQTIALYFSVPDEALIARIVGRIVCKNCGRPYHIIFDPPEKKGICNECSLPLYQRDDDTEELVRKRLEVYYSLTQPVIDYYACRKETFQKIESSGDKESIFQEVLKKIYH